MKFSNTFCNQFNIACFIGFLSWCLLTYTHLFSSLLLLSHRSLFFSLLDKLISFLNLCTEGSVVLKVGLDLVHWQFNQHTSNLWSFFLWDNHSHKLKNGWTYLFLHVWVSFSAGWDNLLSSCKVSLLRCQVDSCLIAPRSYWWTWLWRHTDISILLLHMNWWHWLLWHTHVGILRWNWHTTLWSSLTHVLLLMLSHVALHVLILVIISLVVVPLLRPWWSNISLTLIEMSIHCFVLMHDFNKLLQNLCKIRVTSEVIQVEPTSLLLLISFEVGFVNGFFFLDLSEFFDLVMIDDKGLAIKSLIVQHLFSWCSWIRSLITDESKWVSSFAFRFKSDLFNLSKLWELLLEIIFGPSCWEILDIEVASFLWCFISNSVFFLFNFSLGFGHCMSNIEFWCAFVT